MASAWNKKKNATVDLFTREKDIFLKTPEHFTAQEEEQEEEDVNAPEEVKTTTQENDEEKEDENVACTQEDSEGDAVCELQEDKEEEVPTPSSSALEEVPDVSCVQEEPVVQTAPLTRQQRRALKKAEQKKEKKRLKGVDISRDTGPEISEKTKVFLTKYRKRAEGQSNVTKSSSASASSSSQFEDMVSKKMMDELKEVSRELGESASEYVSSQHRNAGQNVSEKDKEKEMFLQAARSIPSIRNARINKKEFLAHLKPQVSPAGYSQAVQLMGQYKKELLTTKEVKSVLFTLATTD
jgi:hypothetical protein